MGDPGQPHEALVLRLVIKDGEPLDGTIEIEGLPPARAFRGWVELMAAVAEARRVAHSG